MVILSGLLIMIGWVWLIVTAFKSEQIVWGVVMIVFMPSCFIYALLNLDKKTLIPLILVVLSIVIMMKFSPEDRAKMERMQQERQNTFQ